MVKIKAGYVMSAAEKTEFERQDALPRKTYGKVDYYYKPPNKYPARIYVFMQAELWCDRNRRPMGLQNAFPFLSRPMNKEELEYHHFSWRLCYYQYERWDKLLDAEQKEAEECDREMPGSRTVFLEKLAANKRRYPLADGVGTTKLARGQDNEEPELEVVDLNENEITLLPCLVRGGYALPITEISRALNAEQAGQRRKAVIIALRFLYRQAAGEISPEKRLRMEEILKKVCLAESSASRNFVRHTYRQNPLFALIEISKRYPGYTEKQLLEDLQVRSKGSTKHKKSKPITDLRRCQLVKLVGLLRNPELPEVDWHEISKLLIIDSN